MTLPLLATKLYAPPTPEGWVSRPRLLEKLDEVLQPAKKIALISAPPGYGKTTLVSEWGSRRAGAVKIAWLSLEAADNDPARFLLYVIHALRSVDPNLGEIELLALQSPQPQPTEAILIQLINQIAALPETTRLGLVLDDYHLIRSSEAHQAIAFLLDHLPGQLRLILLARADPGLPLARLRAQRQGIELRAADLRFTPEEAAAFLTSAMHLDLNQEEIRSLDARTEGWIAGLQLAALALQGSLSMQGREDYARFIQAFTGSHVYVLDYLTEEVLDRQPEPLQSFLLQSCILERLSGPLCDSVTGQSESQRRLEEMTRSNLFIVALDDEQRWFRYHHLFADLLRAQLERLHPGQALILHQRASRWFASHNFYTEAIHHAVEGEDPVFAADLIEQQGMGALMRGELMTLARWLEMLPEPIRQERAWLLVYSAWAALLTGRLEGIEPCLSRAEILAPAQPDSRRLLGHVAAIRAYALSFHGDTTATMRLAKEALDLLPQEERQVRSIISFVLGGNLLLMGETEPASQALEEAGKMGRESGNLHVAVPATAALGGLRMVMGQLRLAAEAFSQAREMAQTTDGKATPLMARVYSGTTDLYYEWNELDASERDARRGIELGQQWGNVETLAKTHLALGRALFARGNRAEAERELTLAESIAQQHALSPGSSQLITYWKVRLYLSAGPKGLEKAASWLKNSPLDFSAPPRWANELLYLAAAQVRLAIGDRSAGIELLDRLYVATHEAKRMGRVITILAAQAVAFLQSGDEALAARAAHEALALAEPEGFLRSFIDEGEPMRQVLERLRSQSTAPLREYIDRILEAFRPAIGRPIGSSAPVSPTAPEVINSLVEPLSEREQEVLRLIAEGYSNAEIAQRLVIALSTVKRHINHILGKLQSTSRTQAVARARAMGLL